jgi:hypothetical protein
MRLSASTRVLGSTAHLARSIDLNPCQSRSRQTAARDCDLLLASRLRVLGSLALSEFATCHRSNRRPRVTYIPEAMKKELPQEDTDKKESEKIMSIILSITDGPGAGGPPLPPRLLRVVAGPPISPRCRSVSDGRRKLCWRREGRRRLKRMLPHR